MESEHEDNDENINILKYWINKSVIYKNLHLQRYQRLNKINKYFIIPVIILSTITGTANFSQSQIPNYYLPYFVIGIGTLNIISALVTTIYQFLKVSESSDLHKKAYIEWEKFFINLNTEINKNHIDRIMSENDIIKYFKPEYIKLIENSPLIPNYLISKFNNKYLDSIYDENILNKKK